MSFAAITPTSQGQTASSYVVHDGETLRSIAQTTWGDAGLWYMIAAANGLNGSEALVAGQTLIIPARVTNRQPMFSFRMTAAAADTGRLASMPRGGVGSSRDTLSTQRLRDNSIGNAAVVGGGTIRDCGRRP